MKRTGKDSMIYWRHYLQRMGNLIVIKHIYLHNTRADSCTFFCSRLPDDDRDICYFDYYVDEAGEWDPWHSRYVSPIGDPTRGGGVFYR